jgi:cytochrome c5
MHHFTRTIRWAVCCLMLLASADRLLDAANRQFHKPAARIAAAPGRYQAGSVTQATAAEVLGVEATESVATAADRVARHEAASRILHELVLFREGRGMHAAPGAELLYDSLARDPGWKGSVSRAWLSNSMGLVFDDSRQAVGFAHRDRSGVPLIAQGCAVCHSGKVLGQIVPGLGNKTIDPYVLATLGKTYAEGVGSTSEFCGRVANPELSNLTQGMVPVAIVFSWFYQQAGEPLPADMARAAVKVPALWGYGEKRKAGQFCDGVGDGEFAGWAAAVELVGGQHPATVRGYNDELEAIEHSFGQLLPPAYPLQIDWQRAHRGRRLFAAHCQQCHGTYQKDAALLPRFQPPQRVPLADVGTDDDRLRNNTPRFMQLVAVSPLADVLRTHPDYERGYLAPRLEGVWARFPYLHNGSVPNLQALLTKAADRPRAFSLHDAGEVYRFDSLRLGLSTPAPGSADEAALIAAGLRGDRNAYDVGRVGHSNRGHEFGTELDAGDKLDLIEYLKTL